MFRKDRFKKGPLSVMLFVISTTFLVFVLPLLRICFTKTVVSKSKRRNELEVEKRLYRKANEKLLKSFDLA
jgi:hypothetical protein